MFLRGYFLFIRSLNIFLYIIFGKFRTNFNMKKHIILITIASILAACSDDAQVEEEQELIEEVATDETAVKRADKAQKVFQTVPSPYETAIIFEEAGVPYNPEATNPIDNVNKYTTTNKQALNLGVYGADLSYANIYDQTQESMFYMNCAKKMADAMGVSAAFSPETMERIEVNMNNRDSMMLIVNDSYWICDAYLKENGQDNLSALIILGGWVEGLYLGTRAINKDEPNEELMKRIADQKLSLSNLVDLLATYNDEAVMEWSGKLASLSEVYDKIEEVEGETTVTDGDTPVIGGGNTLNYTPEIILEIATETEKIRNEIIQ